MAFKPPFEAEKFPSLFALEESILKFWQENKIFEKSLERNKGKEIYSFYDGPPFITGTPHYATLLPSIVKDIIPRYQTMKGKYVRRKWGWDVHGLPAETQVEKRLGLKSRRDIEKLGIDKFIAECRKYVSEVSEAWRWYIDHIGRWVDMDNAYRTDQLSYMESVIRVFKQLYDQQLIYRGRRTSLYCPRCATPLSKFEITMDDGNYRDVQDPAVTVAFRLLNDETYLLAWTTTPWTLPANLALAVDPTAEYVKVTGGHRQYILAHQALERYRDQDWQILETFKGEKLVGERYEPQFDFFQTGNDTDYRVYPAEFVSMNDGTGIVHVAPGFGEDDSKLGEQYKLSVIETIDAEGHFLPEVAPWAGQFYKAADSSIIEDLQQRKHLIKHETITHSYPHCYRCGTPLIYKAQEAWYLKVEPLRQQLLEKNKEINWVPDHFGSGRFAHNLETAPDWSLSRTRYWGTPIPIWETDDGELFVPESVAELEKLAGQPITDLHRPVIDEVVLTLPNGKKAHRVKEVLDVWFESGSMPYGQDHYPFENEAEFKQHFPTDFIIEYTGQLRGWFYYLHLLANALFKSVAFKNVIVTGVLMGTDGRKMSKSYGNYPDPKATIEKYGGEALRLYFMSSKIMNGEDIDINETEIRDCSRMLNILHNSFQYFLTYANLHHFQPAEKPAVSDHVLDRWILSQTSEMITDFEKDLDNLNLPTAHNDIFFFINDLSTWYIRRSRERFVAGDKNALQTLYTVFHLFSRLIAPSLPFTAEYIFRTLTQAKEAESVHLQDFPVSAERPKIDSRLLTDMLFVRQIASLGNQLRAAAKLPIRQPLASLAIIDQPEVKKPELMKLIAEELNVLEVVFDPKDRAQYIWTDETLPPQVGLNTKLTDQLKEEGRYRELVRQLQEARKKAGLKVGEVASLQLHSEDTALTSLVKAREEDLKKQVTLSAIELQSDTVDLEPIKEDLAVKFVRPSK